MTALQHDPSAHAPWTSTIFALSLMCLIDLPGAILRRPEHVRLSQLTLFQSVAQLRPTANSKFGEDPVQMPTDGSVGEKQAFADLTI
jgi:hypothetical protein